MRITIELRQPARRSVVLVIALLALAVPGVAVANHQFPDVLNSNPFHNDISAIAAAGITAGFGDGGYHPTAAVTRQSMAAFMRRGFGSVAFQGMGTTLANPSIPVAPGADQSAPVVVREISIVVPGASNTFTPEQRVHVQGRVTINADLSFGTSGCPCEFAAVIYDSSSMAIDAIQAQTFQSAQTETYAYSFDVEAVVWASPGLHTYQLQVALSDRYLNNNGLTVMLDPVSTITAMTFPFDMTAPS
ncbi:MAG: S-layer homology domain-containing protein [Candidatus Limnocylindrales bacterium]